jgi:hypothetical protein
VAVLAWRVPRAQPVAAVAQDEPRPL